MIEAFGWKIERVKGLTVRVDGKLRFIPWFLGDLTKGGARKLRKAFRGAGWHDLASSRRVVVPAAGIMKFVWTAPFIILKGENQ